MSKAQGHDIKSLIGKWEAVDFESRNGGLEVMDSAKLFIVYGNQRKEIVSYKADFTKSPALFDFTIKDSTETLNLKSLIQFINEDLIQWQVFEEPIRYASYTGKLGDIVYLRRKK